MAVSSISSLTKLRLTGLSSGLDTDTIIKQMMQIEQLKINRQYRARTTLQWRQQALGGVKSDLQAFHDEFISVLGKKSMMKESTYNTFKAEVTGDKANAVTISTTSSAKAGSITINSIRSLAKGAEAVSSSTNKATRTNNAMFKFDIPENDPGPDRSMTLEQLNSYFNTPLTFDTNGEASFKINNTEITVNKDMTIGEMVSTINSSGAGVTTQFNWNFTNLVLSHFNITSTDPGVQLSIEDVTGNVMRQFTGLPAGTITPAPGISRGGGGLGTNAKQTMLKDLNLAQPLQFVNNEVSFSINGKTFTFKDTDTLGTMMNTINSSDADVEMGYSELTDKFTFTSKTKGSSSLLTIHNFSGNVFGYESAFGLRAGYFTGGTDAVLEINGIAVRRDTNDFTIDGVRYQLNKTTQKADGSGYDELDITVSPDIEPAVESIKEFVSGYNTMITKLQNMLTERKSNDEKDYIPLTEDEKSEMTEKQIEEWEAIAKKGLLKNNAGIQSMLSRLRGALYETVGSVGLTPADIGLKTGTYDKGGLIELDEVQLRSALDKDPNAVMRMFTDMSTDGDRTVEYKESGLLMRMSLIFDDYTEGTSEIALDGIEYSLKQVNNKISAMLEKMAKKEERLYAQYAAMETALSKVQAQSDWLTNMLGSMNK